MASSKDGSKQRLKLDERGCFQPFQGLTITSGVKDCATDPHWREIYALLRATGAGFLGKIRRTPITLESQYGAVLPKEGLVGWGTDGEKAAAPARRLVCTLASFFFPRLIGCMRNMLAHVPNIR